MWGPYLEVVAERAGAAIHVLDRFHIMATMNKAIDEVRAAEAKRLKADGYEPVLTHSRWCLQQGCFVSQARFGVGRTFRVRSRRPQAQTGIAGLKRRENLTEQQTVKLSEVLQYNLKTVRAYLQKGDFQRFWEYKSPSWPGSFWTNGAPA